MNDQPGWTLEDLEKAIEDSWDAQADISPTTIGFQRETAYFTAEANAKEAPKVKF